MTMRRVMESRMPSLSGGVQRLPCWVTQKNAACCTSIKRPSGVVRSASPKPRSSARRFASMLPA